MKTFSYFLVTALLFFFIACSDKNSSVVTPYENVKASSQSKIVETAVVTPSTPLPFFTKFDQAKYDLTKLDLSNNNTGSSNSGSARKAAGPFTVAGNLRMIFHNRKVILGTNQSLYNPGAYFCDVYICDYTLTLPSGQFAGLYGASKNGYNNFDTQVVGINNVQVQDPNTGASTYTFSTYSIVPLTNVLGQPAYVGTIPQDLTGLTYTYGIFP
ncbi:hypothetical protein [Spirosoma validum]|uniref:Lipoprotein n=1 Tax=Spirosoma validum TaxID=2771355 RepID=A0A927B205_9BACT|nr:hypothetical protein [Spirosoma validum]MBD2753777.1 hypothetical protein [Spirosoma validum]